VVWMVQVMRKKTIINNKDGLIGHQFEGFLPVQYKTMVK